MKNVYPKSKFKVHPSPSPPSDTLSVLNLLPSAIFTLTAALAFKDREVVAYLMIRSLYGLGPTEAEERRRCRRTATGAHRPAFDYGCFDCYTWFWSRWDCSSDRNVIYLVVEGFEEHLAMKETRGREARRKRKKREKEESLEENEDGEEAVEMPAVVGDKGGGNCAGTEQESQREEAAVGGGERIGLGFLERGLMIWGDLG